MLPRSIDLLLQLLHRDPRLPEPADLARLGADDWDALTAQAIGCRLAFQVAARLEADPQRRACVPAACLARLNEAVRTTLLRNLWQLGHLRDMLTALKAADLPVLLLKGLWLAQTVYRDQRARVTGDIDLLFRPHDMPRVTRLARERGFDVPANVDNFRDLAPSGNQFPLRHAGRNVFFDVHWSMTQPPAEQPVDEEGFWQRSETVELAGVPCRGLGLEDQLLYVCFHAVDHHRFLYVGPRALLDAATLIATPPRALDWGEIVARARETHWQRGVWLLLDLAREFLGAPTPATALAALQPAAVPDDATRRAFVEALFLTQQHTESLPANVVRALDDPSWLGRLALLRRRLLPGRDAVATYFNRPADAPEIYWLYARRMVALGARILPKVGHLLSGDAARQRELERVRLINRWFDG